MDYELMHKKLEAVRKEIRKNVFHLNIIDIISDQIQLAFEYKLWQGEVNNRLLTKTK